MDLWGAYKFIKLATEIYGEEEMEKAAGMSPTVMMPLVIMSGIGGAAMYGKARQALMKKRMDDLRMAQMKAQLKLMKKQGLI